MREFEARFKPGKIRLGIFSQTVSPARTELANVGARRDNCKTTKPAKGKVMMRG